MTSGKDSDVPAPPWGELIPPSFDPHAGEPSMQQAPPGGGRPYTGECPGSMNCEGPAETNPAMDLPEKPLEGPVGPIAPDAAD
jgi:hypothetical protein